MRWLRRLRPRRPACSHRSRGRRLGGEGSWKLGQWGWPEAWGCSLQRTPGRRWEHPGPFWARAHTPPGLGWAAGLRAPHCRPAGSALVAEGGGGGKAPVTSGSRGSGREGRGGGGETTADWCTLIIHRTQWIASSRPARAPQGSAPAAGCNPAVTPLLPVGSPRCSALGELLVELWAPPSRGCSRRKGREER